MSASEPESLNPKQNLDPYTVFARHRHVTDRHAAESLVVTVCISCIECGLKILAILNEPTTTYCAC